MCNVQPHKYLFIAPFVPAGVIILTYFEEYLDVPGYKESVIDSIQTLHDNGKWKIMEKKVLPDYFEDKSGVLYILEVCK